MFKPVSPIGAIVAAPAGGFGVDQLRMRRKDNALAGLAQAQAIVDIVERHREAGFVHSADRKIVASSGRKAGRSHRAAFVRHKQLIEKAGIITESVGKGVSDRKVHAQHDAAVLYDAARPG